jgi:hypothetical protein
MLPFVPLARLTGVLSTLIQPHIDAAETRKYSYRVLATRVITSKPQWNVAGKT